MKGFIFGLLILACFADKITITKEYTDYLKRHVTWEVQDYEDNIFRGWTDSEVAHILGDRQTTEMPEDQEEVSDNGLKMPSSLDWAEDKCVHKIRNQGSCGSCWAFSVAGVTSDRCCLAGVDHNWLAPQELVSCDTEENEGCNGGDRTAATSYVAKNGLVHEECYPYTAKDSSCAKKCADGKEWDSSHVCKCKKYEICQGADKLARCLASGPVAVGMKVYADFLHYKSGVYRWDKKSDLKGYHAIRMVGYGPDFWRCANSWGEKWGEGGYFKIGKGECDIETRSPVICVY
jgi:C1A family cysteine protease